jgi:hypothetical protein
MIIPSNSRILPILPQDVQNNKRNPAICSATDATSCRQPFSRCVTPPEMLPQARNLGMELEKIEAARGRIPT